MHFSRGRESRPLCVTIKRYLRRRTGHVFSKQQQTKAYIAAFFALSMVALFSGALLYRAELVQSLSDGIERVSLEAEKKDATILAGASLLLSFIFVLLTRKLRDTAQVSSQRSVSVLASASSAELHSFPYYLNNPIRGPSL